MALSRIALGWLAVVGWFLVWEGLARQVSRGRAGPWIRAPLGQYAGEALLLTLFGALWFASLGASGWWLVFGLVGALREWPSPAEWTRQRRRLRQELGGRALSTGRIVAAGGLLAWGLGPS